MAQRDVFVVGAARTAVGSFLGGLSTVEASKLGAICIKESVERARVPPDAIDEVLMGQVLNLALSASIDMPDNNAINGLLVARLYSSIRNIVGWIPGIGHLWIAMQDRLTAKRFKVGGYLGDPEVESLAWRRAREGSRRTFDTLQNNIRLQR